MRHLAVADADRLVQDLRDGRQAVGRARGVADDVMALGVVDLLEVHADHHRRVQRLRALAGRGDDHLAGAGGEMLGGCCARAVAAGGLDHDVHPQLAPRQVRRATGSASARIGSPATTSSPSVDSTMPGNAP